MFGQNKGSSFWGNAASPNTFHNNTTLGTPVCQQNYWLRTPLYEVEILCHAICGLILLLVFSFAPQVFSQGTPFFSLSAKTNISKLQFNQKSGRWRTTYCMDVLPLNHYWLIDIYLFITRTCCLNMKSVLVSTCISHVINPLESKQLWQIEKRTNTLIQIITNKYSFIINLFTTHYTG